MPRPTDILVVGGSGVVGRRVAAQLASEFPDRVVVAARDVAQVAAVCRELGHGTRWRRIDVDDVESVGPALDGVGTIINCVAQHELHLLRSAISRGLAYTDIAPRLAFWELAESMAAEARSTGARVVLGAGLSPGISNMMARHLARELGSVDRIETSILLSLGDEYGPDSFRHVLAALTQPFDVFENGRRHAAVPFSDGRPVDFPAPMGRRTAFLFPWSDVVHYPRTLGAQTAFGRFALEPVWAGRLANALVGAGAQRWLTRPGVGHGDHLAMKLLGRLCRGQDRFGLVVMVEGGGRVLRMSLGGRHQADATAVAAAQFARALADGEVEQAGVFLPEEAISHERFFQALTQHGWTLRFNDSSKGDIQWFDVFARRHDRGDFAAQTGVRR